MKSDDSEASKSEEEKEEINEEEEEEEEQEKDEEPNQDENQDENQEENQEEQKEEELKEEELKEEELKEEEQKEEEQKEEVEAEEESDHVNVKEFDNQNSFIISLQLIKTFDNMHQGDPETTITDFLKNVGLPMHFNSEDHLALYLYFHKMCIPFYQLLEDIKSEDVSDIVLNSLKESYYLLADSESKHYNYTDIAKKSFSNLRISEEDTNISKVPIVLQNEISKKSSDLQIKKLILDLGFKSNGRLDVYVKIHIIKAIIIYLNDEDILPYIQIFQQMEDDLIKLYHNSVREKLNQKKYEEYVDIFTNLEMRDKWKEHLIHCRKLIGMFQNVNDNESLDILERLLIQLLGHFEKDVRNNAVKMLNMIYDQTTWQEKSAFPIQNTQIKLMNEQLTLELNIQLEDYGEKNIVLIISAPSENKNVNYPCMTFLKCENEEEGNNLVKLIFPLGTLSKCGYYDWYLVRFSKGRFTNIKIINDKKELIEAKGRIIALNKDINEISAHEVYCDLIGADIDKNQGRIVKRGSFQNLERKLDELYKRYINLVYIMGALERDNEIAYDEETAEAIDIGNDKASPMAVTSRSNISSLLGGEKSFISLINKAHKLSMKIVIDSLSRISSSRAHRKYRDILLRYLDTQGKMQICYGSDGKSVRYEDSAILNYRKKESWDLLISEILTLIGKYKIDGVHLDNCQAWPHIMEMDTAELYRIDIDGKPAYTPLEILNGEVVMPNVECGYWDTDNYETYANPLLIKLTRNVWNLYPSFIFIGECWLNEKFSQRHVSLTKSGIIPRLYTLPIILCEVLGKKIQRDGRIDSAPPTDITLIKDWYNENYKDLPEGALLMQSSSGQVWPYPALLFGRGNWSAVGLLFSLPDIPMTFMDEIDGEAYRVQITNVYESKENKQNDNQRFRQRSKSLLKLIESQEQEKREREQEGNRKPLSRSSSIVNFQDYIPQYNLNESIASIINLSGVAVNQTREIDNKQMNLVRSLGPDQGFDLTKIHYHYDHYRKLRNKHQCLRKGKIIYLKAMNNNGQTHPGVLAFARQTEEETGIFAINFRDQESNFLLDLKPLIGEESNPDTICFIQNWECDDKGNYFFLRELTQGRMTRKIGPFQSVCFSFSVSNFSQDIYRKTMETSNSIMINELENRNDSSVDSFQSSIKLKEILNKKLPLEEFSKWISFICDILSRSKISFNDYIKKLDFVVRDEKSSNDFFSYCYRLANTKNMMLSPQNLKIAQEAENIYNSNVIGPICFVTPELGRWSTVGGLGIMVDELSQGLSAIGQEVIMISPYYNQNRKGQSGYLNNDPFNIHYIRNVGINLDNRYEFGVHYGTGNGGIKYYFLHNANIFPRPYPDFGPAMTVREIACFAKASLQLLCDLQTIPSIVLTNDWFTGLTPAYAKNGSFGDTFRGTTFMHICHNLEPTYEGRLYPSPQEGTLEGIYQFDPNWLIDFSWKQRVINPSRCAIMMSDQWATVSNSYRDDLRNSSPLNHFLNQKPRPFSYPNGIFKEKRLKQLNEKCGLSRPECKKYIQQKYFGYGDADYSVPIFSFVGRITQQKGVLLILDVVEEMIRITGGKINILVGGMGDRRDPYVGACVHRMYHLKGKYPYAFWADPNEFFTDGPKINKGSDFGLMPSLFEPGGIVQHEFFIAGTPVIAFRTGGLKDTVFEFRWDNNSGNGLTFDNYNGRDLVGAMRRAIDLFKNKEKYEICRKNAFNSAIDVADVSRAWCREFYRLKNKIYFNVKEVKNSAINNTSFNPEEARMNYLQGPHPDYQNRSNSQYMYSNNPNMDPNVANITFSYKFNNRNPKSVFISGSFDNWKEKHPLTYNQTMGKWACTLKLKKGKYLYKYIIDGNWEINPNELSERGNDGITNNVINV